MVCFTMLGEHDALKSEKQNPLKVMSLCEQMSSNHLCLPPSYGAEVVCFTILGEHDALKSDEPTSLKVMPLSSETPTFDANLCPHITLACPPLGS